MPAKAKTGKTVKAKKEDIAVENVPAQESVQPEQKVAQPVPVQAAPEVVVVPKKKILFVASEATPFIATGGLAEVIGSLSKALAVNENYDVRVVIPLYSDISWEYMLPQKPENNLSLT